MWESGAQVSATPKEESRLTRRRCYVSFPVYAVAPFPPPRCQRTRRHRRSEDELWNKDESERRGTVLAV